MKIHIAQKGDTLWKIAKKYGADFEEIKKMNSQLSNPDMILPGMKIKVPTAGVPVRKEAQGEKKGTYIKEKPIKEMENMLTSLKEKTKQEPQEPPVKELPPSMETEELKGKKPTKEILTKEMPKLPPLPKLPPIQPLYPEVDINANYYNVNMSMPNMSAPKQPPEKPLNVPKEVQLPEMEESSEELEIPAIPQMPTHTYPSMQVPITPVMPGYGFNFVPYYPCPPVYPYPMVPQHPAGALPYETGESPESAEYMVGGEENTQLPVYPGAGMSPYIPPYHNQMPHGPGAGAYYHQPMYPSPFGMGPIPQMPQPFIQPPGVQGTHAPGYEAEMQPAQGYQPYPMTGQQPMQDCGCGSPYPYYPPAPYPYATPQVPAYGVNPYGMMGGYMPQQPIGMNQPVQPRPEEHSLFGFPEYDDDDVI